jgi:hypothetical protein
MSMKLLHCKRVHYEIIFAEEWEGKRYTMFELLAEVHIWTREGEFLTLLRTRATTCNAARYKDVSLCERGGGRETNSEFHMKIGI